MLNQRKQADNRERLSVSHLKLETRQDIYDFERSVRLLLQEFEPDADSAYIDLAEYLIVILRLGLISKGDLNTSFERARYLRKTNQLDHTWRYLYGVLKKRLEIDGRFAVPILRPNNKRQRSAMPVVAAKQQTRDPDAVEKNKAMLAECRRQIAKTKHKGANK